VLEVVPTDRTQADGASPSDALLTLVEMIEDLSDARTIEQVAGVVRSSARRISGADGVAFVLRDEGQCYYLDEEAIDPLWKGLRFPMSACIAGWAMSHRETVVIPDIYTDERVPLDAYQTTFVKSMVITPIRPRDPIAAIGAYWARARQPTADEIARLQIMARATATAMDSALMYASLVDTLERRRFLMAELDHRCKNTLATVQSIADQTLRRSQSPQHFVEAFSGRLGALSKAHELLTRESWGPAGLAEILAQALEPFGGLGSGRITMSGPDVLLAPETAVAAQMTFHELAVNAVRHGALSGEAGRLSIDWTVDLSAPQRSLNFSWTETGGPAPSDDRPSGFGSRLIGQGIARELNGRAEMTFTPEGFRFHLVAPLSPRLALG